MSEYTPYVIETRKGTERMFDIWSRLHTDRIIFIGDQITQHTANRVVAQLLYLESDDPENDIQMYINSPGGLISAGLAIYDVMNYIKPDVCTTCYGLAASMGSLLLAAGAPGKRSALPNSTIMIHQPIGGAQGQATDVEIAARRLLSLKQLTTDILSKATGQDPERVRNDTERDNYMTADEAVEYGLIDNVIRSRTEEVE